MSAYIGGEGWHEKGSVLGCRGREESCGFSGSSVSVGEGFEFSNDVCGDGEP